MIPIILGLFAINIVLLIVFVGYHLFFFLSYPFLKWNKYCSDKKSKGVKERSKPRRFAIVIPAHNEELMIHKIIESIAVLDYPKDKTEVYVIADNCTDKTAEIVRTSGVRCEERTDDFKRGKPYALEWFFKRTDVGSYDAFIIVDADTILDPGFLSALNEKINEGYDVIQGYFGIMNPTDTWLTRLSVITGVIKFRVRYFCKTRLGLSCPLMGNGMCFTRNVIAKYGWNAFSLTENWEYYANLVCEGYVPTYAEKAVIYSHAVVKLKHGEIQRMRWVKGRILTSLEYVPKLFTQAIRRRSFVPLDASIELLLPSHSMLLNWNIISLLLSLTLQYVGLPMVEASATLVGLIVAQFLFSAAGLLMSRAPLITWLSLPFIPLFLVWRLIVSAKAVFGIRNLKWEKTNRHPPK